MARGGKREGAGRRPGTPNSVTAAREAEVKASGLTPLDYMIKMLRDEDAEPKDRMWAAEKAAPYVHPKLASIEHSGEITTRHASAMSDDELAAIASGSRTPAIAAPGHPSKPH
jgi:hypothetical protein